MASINLISTKRLTKHFGGIKALDNVDFELPTGQIRALIGPNGAGKSTLVKTICGRTSASSGIVQFQGQDITKLPTHKRIRLGIAYTFQITSIFARLSVYENVALSVRRVFGGNDKIVWQHVTQTLERVSLANRADQLAGDLSYGHQRLLEIGIGLAQNPKLFILDEPTQGLADSEIEAFKNLIKSMAGDTTILLIEHNMSVVMGTAEYITVLDQGKILANGNPAEIHANSKVQAAYLGSSHA